MKRNSLSVKGSKKESPKRRNSMSARIPHYMPLINGDKMAAKLPDEVLLKILSKVPKTVQLWNHPNKDIRRIALDRQCIAERFNKGVRIGSLNQEEHDTLFIESVKKNYFDLVQFLITEGYIKVDGDPMTSITSAIYYELFKNSVKDSSMLKLLLKNKLKIPNYFSPEEIGTQFGPNMDTDFTEHRKVLSMILKATNRKQFLYQYQLFLLKHYTYENFRNIHDFDNLTPAMFDLPRKHKYFILMADYYYRIPRILKEFQKKLASVNAEIIATVELHDDPTIFNQSKFDNFLTKFSVPSEGIIIEFMVPVKITFKLTTKLVDINREMRYCNCSSSYAPTSLKNGVPYLYLDCESG